MKMINIVLDIFFLKYSFIGYLCYSVLYLYSFGSLHIWNHIIGVNI